MEPLRFSRARDLTGPGPRPVCRILDPALLLGTWVNFDAASRGLTRIVVSSAAGQPGGMAVRAFGAGSPQPEDWGEVAGAPFAGGVDLAEGVGFTASYDFGAMAVTLASYLNKRLLVVDAYTRFHDGSGRAGYFARDHFYIP